MKIKLTCLSAIAGILLSSVLSTAMACGCADKKADKPSSQQKTSSSKVDSAKIDND